MLYHGVSGRILLNTDHQPYVNYSAGVLILDTEEPRKVIYRSTQPILQPLVAEERRGIVPNVVFPTGVDLHMNAGKPSYLDVYYGMADSSIGAARMWLP